MSPYACMSIVFCCFAVEACHLSAEQSARKFQWEPHASIYFKTNMYHCPGCLQHEAAWTDWHCGRQCAKTQGGEHDRSIAPGPNSAATGFSSRRTGLRGTCPELGSLWEVSLLDEDQNSLSTFSSMEVAGVFITKRIPVSVLEAGPP